VPDSSVTEFCTDWGTAVCQLSSFCQFDATSCATYQTTVCNQFATAATASGTRSYGQPGGLACINALKAAYGGNPSMISGTTLASLQDTCNKAFTGSVATDSNCTSNYDCVSGDTCSPIPGGTASVCASTGSAKNLGDICAPGDTCQGDSYCAPVMNAEPKCTADPTSGGACNANIPCGSGLYCANGTCASQLVQGALNCSSNSDCTTGYCDTYPPAACTTGLTFARGSIDCNGIAGMDQTPADAGVTQDSGSGGETSTGGDAAGE